MSQLPGLFGVSGGVGLGRRKVPFSSLPFNRARSAPLRQGGGIGGGLGSSSLGSFDVFGGGRRGQGLPQFGDDQFQSQRFQQQNQLFQQQDREREINAQRNVAEMFRKRQEAQLSSQGLQTGGFGGGGSGIVGGGFGQFPTPQGMETAEDISNDLGVRGEAGRFFDINTGLPVSHLDPRVRELNKRLLPLRRLRQQQRRGPVVNFGGGGGGFGGGSFGSEALLGGLGSGGGGFF